MRLSIPETILPFTNLIPIGTLVEINNDIPVYGRNYVEEHFLEQNRITMSDTRYGFITREVTLQNHIGMIINYIVLGRSFTSNEKNEVLYQVLINSKTHWLSTENVTISSFKQNK